MDTISHEDFLLAIETTVEQREIWNSCQYDESSSLCFNESITIEFKGKLDSDALKRAFTQLLDRHASLRSCFSVDGKHMMIKNHITPSIKHIHYESINEVKEVEKQECLSIFDLINGPLIRFVLMTKQTVGEETKSYLVLTAHHIVCDGWSWAILTSDLGHFYNNEVNKVFNALPQAAQYWKYSQFKKSVDKKKDQLFWQNIFSNKQVQVDYNQVKNRPSFRTFNSERMDTPCAQETIIRLRDIARKNKVSLYQYLLNAFFWTMSKKAKANDITIGISQAGQIHSEFSDLVGHCVGLLPIRMENLDALNFTSNLMGVKKAMLNAQEHSHLSFGEICEVSVKERDPSRVPLVPVTFNLDVQPKGQGLNFSALTCRFTTNPRFYENFEMFINLTLIGDHAVIENQFNTDLYSAQEISDLQEAYVSLLDHLSLGHQAEDFVFRDDFKKVNLKPTQQTPKAPAPKKESQKALEVEISPSLEEELKSIWKEVLVVEDVKDSDGFFALGGHSLLVTEVILAIKEKLDLTITMKDLFLNQEFSAFKRVVNAKLSPGSSLVEDESLALKIDKYPFEDNTFPLSWQQQRTWRFQKINPDSAVFNLPSLFEFKGDIDVDAFQKALAHFHSNHSLLSCKLTSENSAMPYWKLEEMQKYLYEFEFIDLNVLYKNKGLDFIVKDLVRIHCLDASEPFDMNGRLYRMKLYIYKGDKNKEGEQKTHIFLVQMIHHILWDGWSYDIFLDEFKRNYENIVAGRKCAKPCELTYFDYSQWQSELPNKQFYQEKIKYWLNEFSDLPEPLVLPMKSGLKRIEKKHEGRLLSLKWDEATVTPLESIARNNGTTLFNVLLTAFNLFLSRYSGQDDIAVGTPIRGRDAEDTDQIVGFFVNNIAIRSHVNQNLSFSENLKHVSEKAAMGFENGLVPFDVVVREVVKERDPSRTPIYQSFFIYQDATNRDTQFCGHQIGNHGLSRNSCHTDIDLWARRDKSGMAGGFDFDATIFSHEQMEQMCSDFKYFVSEIAKYGETVDQVHEIELLNPSHFNYVINELNDTQVDFDRGQTIAQLIDTMAKKDPTKNAISSAVGTITYKELSTLSDSLAQYLISKGVSSGQLVGMALPRNHYLPICLLGIIKAGAGYVPLDPTYPQERLSYMIENSKLKLALCSFEDGGNELFSDVETIKLNDPLSEEGKLNPAWNTEATLELGQRKTSVNPDDTCYVIYTSGSTGLPKGVDISHRSMVNFLQSMVKEPGIDKEDTLIAVTTLSFDIAVLEIYAPMLAGASVYICSKEESMFGDSLMEVIKKNNGNILQATPATWRQLVVSGLKEYKGACNDTHIKFKALCGGEPLPNDLKDSILDCVHELWNMYGPTETTVWSSCHQVLKHDDWISIGKPIDNTQIYILSDDLEVCPQGSIGEICIGGVGLAKGYLNRSELTQERFVACKALEGQLIYRTGDLGRYRENGLLECLGRNDGQVKVRGFRIELGEIESIISKVSAVESQVVMVREDRPGDARIVAYFIKKANANISENELILLLKKTIKENLPFYMMPSHFIELSEFPLTLNAKIDRKQLPSPHHSTHEIVKDHPADQVITKSDENIRSKFERIWCDCLNLSNSNVSDSDDFFQVGGHSLLSVTLFSKIETQLGISLPLSVLFQKTTFGELLAELIEHEKPAKGTEVKEYNDSVESDFLVILRKDDSNKKALFLFHGVGGNILNYKKLVKFIPESYDIYGVQSPGVLGEAQLANSVSEMAIFYANDISKLGQYDKVAFSGGSMGGLLAFETARELEDIGKKVELIIMFDTFGPRTASAHLPKGPKESFFSRLQTYSFYKLKKINAQFHYWLSGLTKKAVPHKYRHFLVELNNYSLMNNHKILPFEAKVHLLRGPIAKEGSHSLEDLGWNQAALKGCVSHIVDNVEHEQFVESASAAKALRKLLEGA